MSGKLIRKNMDYHRSDGVNFGDKMDDLEFIEALFDRDCVLGKRMVRLGTLALKKG